MYFRKEASRIVIDRILLTVMFLGALAGCASKKPDGYGAAMSGNTAAQAQAQLQIAEQATVVDAARTYLELIEKMQRAGQWYASLAHTEAFVRQHGNSPEAQLLRADALRNIQQYEKAEAVYQALIHSPVAVRAHRGLGLLQAVQGRYAQALQEFERARQINPVDADILSDMAYALMRSGQLEQARIPLFQAAELAPGNVRVQLNYTLFLLATGEVDKAERVIARLRAPTGKQGGLGVDAQTIESLYEQVQLVIPTPSQQRAPSSSVSGVYLENMGHFRSTATVSQAGIAAFQKESS